MDYRPLLALPLLLALLASPATAQEPKSDGSVSIELEQRELTSHILNRLAFGPRPGQVDEVLAQGWMNWVLEQLEPEKLDDSELDKRLAEHSPSMSMSLGEIMDKYRPAYTNIPPTRAEMMEANRLRAQCQRELTEFVLLRAVYSKRQFLEVMCEFWRNHFNIDHNKDQCQYTANHYEREVIRKHAFGKFGDMLMASAKHPAMLVYLDNARSQRPLSDEEKAKLEKYADKIKRKGEDKFSENRIQDLTRQRGLNENYARELLELHTLGVDNGYTQKDVTECARALTGWSVTFGRNKDHEFVFHPLVHDADPKTVLGWKFTGADGIAEGETIINRLAAHKGTAQFISFKLCRYLVNDRPPAALVERVAKVFLENEGDLKKVYTAIIFSPEFRSRLNYRCKFKTPFEFTASALRATGAVVRNPGGTERNLELMGQPIYKKDDPTGYYDQAEAWLDPGVLVFRWNFALELAAARQGGVSMPQKFYAPMLKLPRDEMAKALVKQIVPDGLDPKTQAILDDLCSSTPEPLAMATKLVGALLGSPAFQQQ